jgi:hypothetical protein
MGSKAYASRRLSEERFDSIHLPPRLLCLALSSQTTPWLRRSSLPGCPMVESPWHKACESAERADNMSARRHIVSVGHHAGAEELGKGLRCKVL